MQFRFLRLCAVLLISMTVSYTFAPAFIGFLQRAHPSLTELVQLAPSEGFNVRLKLAIIGGITGWAPFLAFHILSISRLGTIRRILLTPLLVSYIAFIGGVALGLWLILPLAISFMFALSFPGTILTISISNYVSTSLGIAMVVGIMAQMPVWLITLVIHRLLTEQLLRRYRKAVILVSFTVGAIITPVDPISQFVVAIPMWMTYETSIIVARWLGRHQKNSIVYAPPPSRG